MAAYESQTLHMAWHATRFPLWVAECHSADEYIPPYGRHYDEGLEIS